MIGYPLDSQVSYTAEGAPVYDRAISSAPLRKLFHKLFTDGVMPDPSSNLQVVSGEGMNIIVNPGFCIIQGCLKLEESSRTLAVQASDSAYDRIDTVVMRLNDNIDVRSVDLYVVEGTPAISPVRPDLTRSESIYEIGLADLFIAKNTAVISAQRITDTRYETERCGIISSISRFDTTTLYQQVQADLESFRENEQAEILAWFQTMKDQLDEDAAVNLQNQIGVLSSLLTGDKSSLVKAINEVYTMALNGGKNLVGDEFSEVAEYEPGSYTIKENILWKFTAPKVAGAWDASVVEKVTVAGEMKQINENLGGLSFGTDGDGNYGYYGADGSLVPFKNLKVKESSGVINGSFTANVSCKVGDIIIISTFGGVLTVDGAVQIVDCSKVANKTNSITMIFKTTKENITIAYGNIYQWFYMVVG